MVTRAFIICGDPTTEEGGKGIYLHQNGEFEKAGKILFENYNTEEKVKELVSLGDLSKLGKEIGYQHEFYEETENYSGCLAYHRDRNEELKIWDVNKDFLKHYLGEYTYVYAFKDNQWSCFVKGKEQSLAEILDIAEERCSDEKEIDLE